MKQDMGRHHLIISGPGRAGTTFLVQLLTELGLDTGFAHPVSGIHANCNAGMEWDIRQKDAPYVVKSPALCEYLDDVLETSDVVIDHAIIPVRDLYSAAESRRDVSRRGSRRVGLPGGLWLTKNPRSQESVLARQLHQLVHALVKHDVPTIWLHFPRLVKDPDYLYTKLKPVLPAADLESFKRAFEAVSRPELVHDFQGGGQKPAAGQSFLARLRRRLSL
jgi:hypothetical protein